MECQLRQELFEVETKIHEVLGLMREKLTDEKLEKARSKRDKSRGDKTNTYLLEHKKAPVSTTLHTYSTLAFGDLLKTKLRLLQYPDDLQTTLTTLSERRVELLERMLEAGVTGLV